MHLIPTSLLRVSTVKRLVTHPNRSASVNGKVHVRLTTPLGEYPLRLGVHLENLGETRELRVVPVDSDLVRRFIREVEGDTGVIR